jgi:uncharacterized protein YehS (DUF1456 family)
MINNVVLRSIRYMLDISENKIIEIAKLADCNILNSDLAGYLKLEDEENFIYCKDEIMARFLDGLIYFKRGKDETRPAPPLELPLTNNTVMKKLRVAFELKEEDMHAIFIAAGFPLSRPELSALLRKQGHSNYRECGDQVLRNFLKGLTLRIRK